MPAVSINIITKDQVKPTLRSIRSLESFLRPGDEIVVVDTGSSPENVAALAANHPQFDGVEFRLIQRPDLSHKLAPYIEKWLPEQVGKLQEDGQYKDLRGILDFAEARNVALKASKNDLIFWIDTDDVLVEEEPGKLRDVVERAMCQDAPEYSALFLEYRYAFHEDGSLCTTLKRERVAFKKWFDWKGRCHETLIPKDGYDDILPVGFCEDLPSYIQHTEDRKKPGISDIRNYIIMRRELESLEENEYVDPRTLLYIGNACRGLCRWREAVDFYKKFEAQSGSLEDRHAACLYIASIYMHSDNMRPVDAHDWYQKATEIKPQDPRGYFGMSRCYLAREMPTECLQWFEIGCNFPEPSQSLHSYDPNSVHFQPYIIAARACTKLGDGERGLAYAEKALKFRPNDETARSMYDAIAQQAAGLALTKSIEHVARHFRHPHMAREGLKKLFPYLHAVPEELEKQGVGKQEDKDPREDRPRLAIMCGGTVEDWGPDNIEKGIGGSEKMVLLIAPELQKLGWNVTVYGSIPFHQRGIYPNGVRWEHFSAFDHDQDLDVLVAWRGHGHLLRPVRARKRVLWLHDVQHPSAYKTEILEMLDLAIFESEFHLAPVKDIIPPEKRVVLNNAISVPEKYDIVSEKDPKRVIFLSSADRGLGTVLQMVALAQQQDPEINATVLYGFTPFERKMRTNWTHRQIPDLGRDASLDDYERYIGRLVDHTNARLLHRIGFDQVWEELRHAGIWVYPTRFPEISCMAAMEAQAAGLVCITSGYAALSETILPSAKELGTTLGPVRDGEDYLRDGAKAILAAADIPADDPRRQAQADDASAAYSVETLARRWAEEFKKTMTEKV